MKKLLFILIIQCYFCKNQYINQSTMVQIPAGSYYIGSNHQKYDSYPKIKVKVSTFLIDIYEVSIKQYKTFLQKSNYKSEGPWQRSIQNKNDQLPVRFVSFNDALAYAQWVNKALPTEAQWEIAGGFTKFTYGDQFQEYRSVSQLPFNDGPKAVQFNEKSSFGVFNLAGNVREWTNDWYDRYYRKNQIKNNDLINPIGPKVNTLPELKYVEIYAQAGNERSVLKVVKGGSWVSKYPYQIQSSNRSAHNPNQWFNDVGFRCVINLEDQ